MSIWLENSVQVLDPQSNVKSVISEIAKSGTQEAFYVCDIGEIVRRLETWNAVFPRIKPYYAVRVNDSPIVLEVLAALGTGFDCASEKEIEQVLALGVPPDRLTFANPLKPSDHIRYAYKTGVERMSFDTSDELHKIKQYHPNAKLVIRLRCNAPSFRRPFRPKFGCDAATEAPKLLQLARSLDMDVIGACFQAGKASGYGQGMAAARKVFDYAATLGYDLQLLDVGGGYPGTSISRTAAVLNTALDEHFPEQSRIEVMAGSGAFCVTHAFTLACHIHSLREMVGEDGNRRFVYYINDGLHGTFGAIMYYKMTVVPEALNGGGELFLSTIWGPTCDGTDQVIKDVLLPRMGIGDWIIFEDMGAYSLTLASRFNALPIPGVHFVADEGTWVMLKNRGRLGQGRSGQ